MNTLLSTKNLSKHFGGLQAVNNVDFAVTAGEIHAVIGPNGAGKTTFLSLLAGELTATNGSIHFADKNISHLSMAQRALCGLNRTFQINSLFLNLTVRENIMLAVQARQNHNFKFWQAPNDNHKLKQQAEKILAQNNLQILADAPTQQLSYGQQRQLEIALGVAGEPKLLLLDEPLAGLDAAGSHEMIARLRTLKTQHNFTLVLVEHDMDAVFALADRISVLNHGCIIATGTPAEIRNHSEVRAAYLGGASLGAK